MKANELRIGNYVKYSDLASAKKGEIVMVDMSDLILLKNMTEGCFYEPIPLTPEILKKAGFKFGNTINGLCYRLDSTPLRIHCSEDLKDWYLYLGQINTLKFLHELQNLHFALTGNEMVFNGKFW